MDHENAVKIIKDNFTGRIFNIFSNYGSLLQIDFSEKNTKGDNIWEPLSISFDRNSDCFCLKISE